MIWTLRPRSPPRSANHFQYTSLPLSKAFWGIGAAPVIGACTPILITVSETPVRSTGAPPIPEAGEGEAGSVFTGPVDEGVISDDVGWAPEATGDDGPTERP